LPDCQRSTYKIIFDLVPYPAGYRVDPNVRFLILEAPLIHISR